MDASSKSRKTVIDALDSRCGSIAVKSWSCFTTWYVFILRCTVFHWCCHNKRQYQAYKTRYQSSVENPGWLFDIGDYTTQLYGDFNKPL